MSSLAYASTFSKDPAAWGFDQDTYVTHARGSSVWLNDGKGYIDWVSGLGTNLLGYGVHDTHASISPSLPHRLEHRVADKLVDMIGNNVPALSPEGLQVHWCKTGSEATNMAVRLARAVTGRKTLVCFDGHYHGWHDFNIGRARPAHGIPDNLYTLNLEWGNTDRLEAEISKRGLEDDIAGFIFEFPATDPPPGWCSALERYANSIGAVLIADEVVTGLRYGLGGACARYGITPNLICMGKALGNGAAIGALIGVKEYMRWFAKTDPVFCSSTTWGETGGLTQADFVLSLWSEQLVERLWELGHVLMLGLVNAGWDVFGHSPRSIIRFKDEYERAAFIHGMRERGVLMNRPNFPSIAHSYQQAAQTFIAATEVRKDDELLEMIKANEGDYMLPKVLFANR